MATFDTWESIWHIPSTLSPPAPVYSPLKRSIAVPGGQTAGIGTCLPFSESSISGWSMCSRPSSCGRRFTTRTFPFLDVLDISNFSSAIAEATQCFQSAGVTAFANSATAAAISASAAASAAASASSSSADASGMPSPFLPASKKAPPPSTSQLGASPPMDSIAGLAAAPGTATWTKNSADWSSSFMVSMYRPLRYFTGMSSTSVRRMPAGSSSASLARTSSGFIRSVSTISIISASELAPRGSAIAVEILGLELYGERVMDTGSDALRHARSNSRRVSRCPMKDSLPSLVNRNRRRWVRRPSGS
mmetsp:Transcript_2068/g.8037  ORF Transcript_2068/g.8037 Transcript_2068/m.8037 type:complete len:305 (-) Transcript_2068:2321-3235(-)